MRRRLEILRINLVNKFRVDVAYFGENWSNVLSTVLYVSTHILFIEILFSNVSSIADFSKNDIYFLLFFGQLVFYAIMETSFAPARRLSEDVNSGNLDFVLTRPVPSAWYLMTRSISPIRALRDGIPAMIPLIIIIDWSALSITTSSLIAGGIIYVFGMLLLDSVIRMLSYTCFWTGSSSLMVIQYYWAQSDQPTVPFNQLPRWFKGMAFLAFPTYIPTTLGTSVALGYTSAQLWVPLTMLFTTIVVIISWHIWNLALRRYASASS